VRPARDRLLRKNGGSIVITFDEDPEPSHWDQFLDDPTAPSEWPLHPVWDASSRETMRLTARHIVRAQQSAHEWSVPQGSIEIAENGTGDRLLLMPASDEVFFWDHETGETERVEVDWA
jgi:hypothetical protein